MTDNNEITPQSNYVTVLSDGVCMWNPRFDLSVTQCPVDVTWFPFDEQKCDLVFESWLLQQDVLKIETESGYFWSSVHAEEWHITGVY